MELQTQRKTVTTVWFPQGNEAMCQLRISDYKYLYSKKFSVLDFLVLWEINGEINLWEGTENRA